MAGKIGISHIVKGLIVVFVLLSGVYTFNQVYAQKSEVADVKKHSIYVEMRIDQKIMMDKRDYIEKKQQEIEDDWFEHGHWKEDTPQDKKDYHHELENRKQNLKDEWLLLNQNFKMKTGASL